MTMIRWSSSILVGPPLFELEEPAAGLVEEETHSSQGHSTDGGSLAHGAAVGQENWLEGGWLRVARSCSSVESRPEG
jgi:hypothetical protein